MYQAAGQEESYCCCASSRCYCFCCCYCCCCCVSIWLWACPKICNNLSLHLSHKLKYRLIRPTTHKRLKSRGDCINWSHSLWLTALPASLTPPLASLLSDALWKLHRTEMNTIINWIWANAIRTWHAQLTEINLNKLQVVASNLIPFTERKSLSITYDAI